MSGFSCVCVDYDPVPAAGADTEKDSDQEKVSRGGHCTAGFVSCVRRIVGGSGFWYGAAAGAACFLREGRTAGGAFFPSVLLSVGRAVRLERGTD